MNVLALETATPQVGVALLGDGGLLAADRVAGGRRHGELLAPMVAALLGTAGLTVAELAAVAVDVGPGLFTGLRVGLATGQALSAALGIPGVGVTSLEALAHPHRRELGVIAAVVDARRHEVFRALYRGGGPGLVELSGPQVATPADLAAELAGLVGEGPVLAVGDGARRYAGVLAAPGVEVGGPLDAHPDPAVVAELAAVRLAGSRPGRGEVGTTRLVPVYLRQADVRIGWDRREGTGAERGSDAEVGSGGG